MRRSILSSLCVLALVGLPVGGCGDEGTRTGGSGGSGGVGGGTGGSPVSCEGTVCPCSEGGILAAITQGGGTYTFACDGPTTVVTEAVLVVDNDV